MLCYYQRHLWRAGRSALPDRTASRVALNNCLPGGSQEAAFWQLMARVEVGDAWLEGQTGSSRGQPEAETLVSKGWNDGLTADAPSEHHATAGRSLSHSRSSSPSTPDSSNLARAFSFGVLSNTCMPVYSSDWLFAGPCTRCCSCEARLPLPRLAASPA